MKDSKALVEQAAREAAASKPTSATAAGRTERPRPDDAHVDAINQVFALFRLNYHNQYYAAYPDAQQLNQIKKLWLESLAHYPVEQILLGARHAIEHSEYLPTLNRMLDACQQGLSHLGLPAPRDAYLEACQAPSPKAAHHWSHAAVYLAGRDSDWFFLANNAEYATWPVFRDNYRQRCEKVLAGESLEVPEVPALEEKPASPMDTKSQAEALAKLREQTGL